VPALILTGWEIRAAIRVAREIRLRRCRHLENLAY